MKREKRERDEEREEREREKFVSNELGRCRRCKKKQIYLNLLAMQFLPNISHSFFRTTEKYTLNMNAAEK